MAYGLSNGFIIASSDFAYIGFDHTNVLSVTDAGRKSVRITPLQKYNGDKLFVFNADHMPTTSVSLPRGCGLGPHSGKRVITSQYISKCTSACNYNRFFEHPSWPNQCKVDVIDYINIKETCTPGAHTTDGCNMETQDTGLFSGVYHWADSTGRPADNCYIPPISMPAKVCR
jgi:hypothetical protein